MSDLRETAAAAANAARDEVLREQLRKALAANGGSRSGAAATLGLSTNTIYNYLRTFPEIAAEFPGRIGRPRVALSTDAVIEAIRATGGAAGAICETLKISRAELSSYLAAHSWISEKYRITD